MGQGLSVDAGCCAASQRERRKMSEDIKHFKSSANISRLPRGTPEPQGRLLTPQVCCEKTTKNHYLRMCQCICPSLFPFPEQRDGVISCAYLQHICSPLLSFICLSESLLSCQGKLKALLSYTFAKMIVGCITHAICVRWFDYVVAVVSELTERMCRSAHSTVFHLAWVRA